MNSILKLDLYKNPVKLSKMKRVYSKMNKDEPLKYNIKNGKVGIKEMIHLIEMYDAYQGYRGEAIVNEEKSLELSKKYNKTLVVFDSEELSNMVLVYNDEESWEIPKSIDKYNKIKVFDSTNTIHSSSSINISSLMNEQDKKQEAGFRKFQMYAERYFSHTSQRSHSLEEAMYIQKELAWSNDDLNKFREEAKLYPGDVCPSFDNMISISAKIKYILGDNISEGEMKHLTRELEIVYLEKEGSFPNKDDLFKIVKDAHFKNKDEIISMLNKEEKINIHNQNKFSIFNKRYNEFISEYNKSDISSLSALKVTGAMWNEAFKNNAIPEFYEILLALKETYHVIVKEPDDENIFPQIYVTFKTKMEIDKLDLKKIASNQE